MINAALRTVLAAVLLLIVTPSHLSRTDQVKRRKMEIEMCDFNVPKELARANTTFSIVYGLQVGDDGRPTKVEKVRIDNDLPFSDELFVRCIKGWVLPTSNQRVTVVFQWMHGKGWTQIEISGPDFDYFVKVQPGAFNQYGSSAN